MEQDDLALFPSLVKFVAFGIAACFIIAAGISVCDASDVTPISDIVYMEFFPDYTYYYMEFEGEILVGTVSNNYYGEVFLDLTIYTRVDGVAIVTTIVGYESDIECTVYTCNAFDQPYHRTTYGDLYL